MTKLEFAVLTGAVASVFAPIASVFASGPNECPPPYVAQWGDTLSGIAKSHRTTVENLAAINPHITNVNEIYAGRTRIVFCPGPNTGGLKSPTEPGPAEVSPVSPDGFSPQQARDLRLINDALTPRTIELKSGWYRIKTNGQPWQINFAIPDAKDKIFEVYSMDQWGELMANNDWAVPGRVKPKGIANGADGNKAFNREGYSTLVIDTAENRRGAEEGGTDWLIHFTVPSSDPNQSFPVEVLSRVR